MDRTTSGDLSQLDFFENVKSDLELIAEGLIWLSDNISSRDSRESSAKGLSRAVVYSNTQVRVINRIKQFIFRDRKNLMKFHDLIQELAISHKINQDIWLNFFKLYSQLLPQHKITETIQIKPDEDWIEIALKHLNPKPS